MITWDTLNDLLKIMLYIAGVVLIVSAPIVIILSLIRTPLDHILKAWGDHKLRTIDNAMRATEIAKLPNGTLIMRRFVNGRNDYEIVHEPRQLLTGVVQSDPDVDAMGAARWIVASYATHECKNPKHQHGPNGRQLLTQDECLDQMFAVFGSPREWQAARDWLTKNKYVVEQTGMVALPGTQADRPLSEMIKILTPLPRKP